MTDIVERLEKLQCPTKCNCALNDGEACIIRVAGGEIERLESELKAARDAVAILRWGRDLFLADNERLRDEIVRLRSDCTRSLSESDVDTLQAIFRRLLSEGKMSPNAVREILGAPLIAGNRDE